MRCLSVVRSSSKSKAFAYVESVRVECGSGNSVKLLLLRSFFGWKAERYWNRRICTCGPRLVSLPIDSRWDPWLLRPMPKEYCNRLKLNRTNGCVTVSFAVCRPETAITHPAIPLMVTTAYCHPDLRVLPVYRRTRS